MPVLIGGHGAKRTPELTARYADEFNIPFASLADTEQQFQRVRAAAERAGRKVTTSCTRTRSSPVSAGTTAR